MLCQVDVECRPPGRGGSRQEQSASAAPDLGPTSPLAPLALFAIRLKADRGRGHGVELPPPNVKVWASLDLFIGWLTG